MELLLLYLGLDPAPLALKDLENQIQLVRNISLARLINSPSQKSLIPT